MDSAVKILLIELKKVPGDVRNEAILLSKTGVILKETKNTDKAMRYMKMAEEKFNTINDISGALLLSRIDNDKNIGVLYRNEKKFDKALFTLTVH